MSALRLDVVFSAWVATMFALGMMGDGVCLLVETFELILAEATFTAQ
jgi:hypothetical protein